MIFYHKRYQLSNGTFYKPRSVGFTTGLMGDYSFMLKTLSDKNRITHEFILGKMECKICGMSLYGTVNSYFDTSWIFDYSDAKVIDDLSCEEMIIKGIVE